MSFMPAPRERLVPAAGRREAKIAIVGDFTSPFDDKVLKPFTGPAGTILEQCLHGAQMIRGEVYLTNCFKSVSKVAGKHAGEDFFIKKGSKRSFTEKGERHAQMLREELNACGANVIVTLGDPALMALTNFSSSAKYRGYFVESTKLDRVRKIMPTASPAFAFRGNYTNRYLIVSDLRKAKLESGSPELIRPNRKLIYDYSHVDEVIQWLDYINTLEEYSFDTEVINHEIACFSFGPSKDLGIVIPIGHSDFRPQGWTEAEEFLIWRKIDEVLRNEKSTKIIQNAIFDIHFALMNMGLVIRGKIIDTMVGHSVMFPELPKGLDFLGSLYCGTQEYWKDAVKWDNIKDDS